MILKSLALEMFLSATSEANSVVRPMNTDASVRVVKWPEREGTREVYIIRRISQIQS